MFRGEKKYMKRKLVSFGLILSMLFVLTSCSKNEVSVKKRTTEFTIGVVGKSDSSEYWMSVYSGMEDSAKALGVKMLFFAPEAEDDGEAQSKLIESLIKSNVDVLAISPIEALERQPYLDEAQEAGIPVITYDSGFEDGFVPYIGIDNVKAGYEMAKYMAQTVNHSGEIIVVTGELTQLCHKQRLEGICEYMENEPDMKIAHIESGYSGFKMSGEKIENLLNAYPQAKGLVVTSAVTALGIIEGTFSRNLKIVTIDVQEDAINTLKKNRISGLIAQSGYDIGYETIQYAYKMQKDKTKSEDVILDAQLLTPENVGEYLEKYTK